MKKIISVLSCALTLSFAVSSCSWFKLDNQDGWDASVEGQILDATTNQPIQFEQGISTITVVEKGWKAEANQNWNVKSNGSYKNALVFAGQYTMNTLSSNFVAEPQTFELNKGSNTVNFKVTPYVRIEDVHFDMEDGKIKATCKVSSTVPSVNNIGEVRLCIAVDRFVRFGNNGAADDAAALFKDAKVDGTSHIVLYIDPANPANVAEFQYDQPHYVRVAALGAHYIEKEPWDEDLGTDWDRMGEATVPLAPDYSNFNEWMASIPHKIVHHDAEYASDGTVNAGNAYNYGPVYRVDLKTGTFTEVIDW